MGVDHTRLGWMGQTGKHAVLDRHRKVNNTYLILLYRHEIYSFLNLNLNYSQIIYFELILLFFHPSSLVFADFTAIAVLVSFGAVLGKTTLTQLVVLAIVEVVVQILNEHLNVNILKASYFLSD